MQFCSLPIGTLINPCPAPLNIYFFPEMMLASHPLPSLGIRAGAVAGWLPPIPYPRV